MKTISIFFFIILFRSFAIGQTDMVAKFNAHKFPCDSGTSTLENNICSGIKSDYADSLLNKVYHKIIRSINKEIAEDKNRLKLEQLKRDTSKEGKEMILFTTKELDNDQRLKRSIIESQQEWLKVRELNENVIGITCEGGTSCIAFMNQSLIDDTLERIKKLESFYDIAD